MSGDPGASSRPTAIYDVKKDRRDLYSGRAGRFDVVDVPEMSFLMADGYGDPNLVDTASDKGAWSWTMMIWQPEWITPDVAASALDIARIHDEVLPGHGVVAAGCHHEIYLSDPRKTPPDRLRTILRQPAKPSL